MPIRIYELAGELGVESRELLKRARILGLDVTSPLAGVDSGDADQIRAAVLNPRPSTIRAYELARELGVESRDVLECARTLGFDVTSPLAGVEPGDADQIRAAVLNPRPSTIRAYELARELGVESRDVLECARTLGLDVTSPLGSISLNDGDEIRELLNREGLTRDSDSESVAEIEVEPDSGATGGGSVSFVDVGESRELHDPVRRPVAAVEREPQAATLPSSGSVGATIIERDDRVPPSPVSLGEVKEHRRDIALSAAPELAESGELPKPQTEQPSIVAASTPETSDAEVDPPGSGSPGRRSDRSRRTNGGRRTIASDELQPSSPIMPVAPSHHRPSGRFHVAYLLLLATIFAIPFEQAFKIPGLGTLAKALGVAAFAAWFLGVLASGRMRTPVSFHYLFFGLGVWTSLSLYWSLDTSATAGRIVTFFLLFALVLVIWDLCDTPEAVRTALQAYVLGTWVTAISVYLNFAQNNQVKYGRFGSDGAADPNVTSLFLAIGIPIAWYLFLNAENRFTKWINLAYVPAGVLAMALSGSRGGFIAGSVALVYVAVSIPRDKPVALVTALLALVGAVVIVVALVPAESFERIGTVDESIASGDLNGRTEIWQRAWDVYVDHPLLGTGAGSTRKVLGLDKVGHNVGVTAALELGAVGAVLLGAILVVVFRRALGLRRPERRMWLTVLLMWSIGAMSLDLATKKVSWLLFGLLVALAASELAPSPKRRVSTDEPVTALEHASGRWS